MSTSLLPIWVDNESVAGPTSGSRGDRIRLPAAAHEGALMEALMTNLGIVETLDGVPASRPQRYRCDLVVAETVAGPLTVPVWVVRGENPGPTLALTAGVHAGEFTGQIAVPKLVSRLDIKELNGDLIGVVCANPRALELRTSFFLPIDSVNINQSFPGDPFGSIASQVAARIGAEIIGRSSTYMDLHSGDHYEEVPLHVVVPELGDPETDDRSRRLVALFDIEFRNIMGSGIDGLSGVSDDGKTVWTGLQVARNNIGYASLNGIPAIQLEVGGAGRLNPDLVEMELRGLFNVLRHMGMYPGEPVVNDRQIDVFGMYVVTADSAGYFLRDVEPGQRVKQGTPLGTFLDRFGSPRTVVESPLAGWVLMIFSTPTRNGGEPVCIIGMDRDPREKGVGHV